MKHLLVVLLLSISFTAFSQELRASLDNGIAIGTLHTGKQFMFATGARGAIEWKLKYNWVFTTSIGLSMLRSHSSISTSINRFSSNRFASVLLTAKKYQRLTRNGSIFYELGSNNAYLYQRKDENTVNAVTSTVKTNQLGWNFGLFASVGYRGILTGKVGFDVGLSYQDDFATAYTNQINKVKCETKMISFSFYRLKY